MDVYSLTVVMGLTTHHYVMGECACLLTLRTLISHGLEWCRAQILQTAVFLSQAPPSQMRILYDSPVAVFQPHSMQSLR